MPQNTQPLFEYHDLIEAIVAALEMRDTHTLHHSERVSNMTDLICRLLGLGEDEAQFYHIAADLHDIGKLGISDGVLLKAGPLDDSEWKEMQSHTVIGSYILGKVERFKSIASVVRHHHERWDGGGYPDRIAGESIPLGARIIAVADSMDAMLSDRSYRRAMPADTCYEQIQKNIGRMYDPVIAPIVLDNWSAVLDARAKPIHAGVPEIWQQDIFA